jgi:hypothetical protein
MLFRAVVIHMRAITIQISIVLITHCAIILATVARMRLHPITIQQRPLTMAHAAMAHGIPLR